MHLMAHRLPFSVVGISGLVGAFILAATCTIGCGGGGKSYPEASVDFDARSDRNDATTPSDGSPDATPPTVGPGDKLLVKGSIDLIGSGPDTCTNQVPPSGDRWCGFARPSAILGASELWVVNVTKAAAGIAINCDAPSGDPNCLRLSGGLVSDPKNGFRIHGFDGDTLTYSEMPSASSSTNFAWRPGWSAPHHLTANMGLACNGHASTRAAICLENAVSDATNTFFHSVELHAGFLDDQGTPLPLVDTIILQTKDDKMGVKKWGARLTPDGQSVAWSTRASDMGTEDLKVQKLGDATSRVMVASDVDQWTVSADSKKWFWLKTFNFDATGNAPSGTLQSATFPTGAAPLTIATGVADYNEAGPTGVLYRASVAQGLGNLVLAADRDAPATVSMVDKGVIFVFEVSKDGKNASYTKNVQFLDIAQTIPIFDLFVGTGAATPCTLAASPVAVLPPNFFAGGAMVAWGMVDSTTQQVEGVTTTLAGCATRNFATSVFGWTPIGDEGLVFLDTLAPGSTVNEATLRYAKVQSGALPVPGTVIQERAGLAYATLLPTLPAVVYTITSNTSVDGLYINATLPFTVTAATPPPDGGTDATGGSDTSNDGGTTTEAGAPETGGGDTADSDASDAAPGG
jgi:hypothetical protein